MAVETLKCPMCGAPASTDATRCEHCGARLATVACPSCFGMMFVGEKFCSHCGAQAARAEVPAATQELCPRCKVDLNAVVIGNTNLRECSRCEGIWADADALQQICADREKQAAVLGMAAPLPAAADGNIEQNIHYLPCPVCHELMNRVNFAHCSHVIVNVCNRHGTWFDKDELRRIVEFIRAGGLEESRTREIAELESERAQTKAAQSFGAGSMPVSPVGTDYDAWHTGISTAADLLLKLFLK
jgi:Zn-finger nucleic acid-binding protein